MLNIGLINTSFKYKDFIKNLQNPTMKGIREETSFLGLPD